MAVDLDAFVRGYITSLYRAIHVILASFSCASCGANGVHSKRIPRLMMVIELESAYLFSIIGRTLERAR